MTYPRQHLVDVGIDADGLPLDFLRANRLSLVDTGVDRLWILRGHLPERVLDDDGGILANAKFQKEDFLPRAGSEKILITLRRSVPAFILDKLVV